MPDWLSAEAKVEWKRIVPELLELGLLTTADRAVLAGYCQAFAELKICTKVLDDEGRALAEPIFSEGAQVGERVKKHPLLSAQRDALARVRAFLSEFGLSPASRSRVESTNEPAEEDPLTALNRRKHKAT